MTAARTRHIADLLQIHAEDLAFLWSQRREALVSRKHMLREYGELNERIEAHLQGLLVPGPAALVDWLVPQLAGVDRDDVFAGFRSCAVAPGYSAPTDGRARSAV